MLFTGIISIPSTIISIISPILPQWTNFFIRIVKNNNPTWLDCSNLIKLRIKTRESTKDNSSRTRR